MFLQRVITFLIFIVYDVMYVCVCVLNVFISFLMRLQERRDICFVRLCYLCIYKYFKRIIWKYYMVYHEYTVSRIVVYTCSQRWPYGEIISFWMFSHSKLHDVISSEPFFFLHVNKFKNYILNGENAFNAYITLHV